jgi:hypothetical protein
LENLIGTDHLEDLVVNARTDIEIDLKKIR